MNFSRRLCVIQYDGFKNKNVIEKLTLEIYIWESKTIKIDSSDALQNNNHIISLKP